MEKIILEIRQAEGGDDAKLLTEDMANIYIKASNIQNFKVKPIE